MESPNHDFMRANKIVSDENASNYQPLSLLQLQDNGDREENETEANNTGSASPPSNSNSNQCNMSNGEDDIDLAVNENESDDSNYADVNTRRIFTRKFKQTVIDAFRNDTDCSGNQRATARKFGIHRRQVQKWLHQLKSERPSSNIPSKELLPSSEQTKEIDLTEISNLSRCKSAGSRKQFQSKISNIDDSDSDNETQKQVYTVRKNAAEECIPTTSIGTHSNFDNQSILSTTSEAFDLSKMSSSSMALNLNLSMNSNEMPHNNHPSNFSFNPAINSTNSALMSQFGTNNNHHHHPYLNSNSLLRFYPKTNALLNYNFPTRSNGVSTNKLPFPQKAESPTNLSTTNLSGGEASNSTTPNPYVVNQNQNNHLSGNESSLNIVDEIAYLYPHEDFSLLRLALIRNEVSLTKVKKLSTPPIVYPVSSNKSLKNISNSSERKDSPSPVKVNPLSSGAVHQTLSSLELLRHQNEYLKLLQQAGINLPFPSPGGNENLSSGFGSHTDSAGNYPSWFNSLATATALGLTNPMAEQLHGSKNPRKKNIVAPTFVTPKLPTPSSAILNSKPKTVAAALAASRLSPNQYKSSSANSERPLVANRSKPKSVQKKRQHRNQTNSSAAKKSYDDYIDPSSMVEVVTTPITPPEYSTSNNLYGKDPLQKFESSTNPLHYLNQLLLQSPSSSNKNIFPDMNLPKYFEQLAKPKTTESLNGKVTPSDNHIEAAKAVTELSSPDTTKNAVLQAFIHDNEVCGDARALARKFGLNVRVVMKWIKESTSRHSSSVNGFDINKLTNSSSSTTSYLKSPIGMNGIGIAHNNNNDMMNLLNNTEACSSNISYANSNGLNGDRNPKSTANVRNEIENHHQLLPNISNQYLYKANSTSTSTNKRKNSKPNQICDFVQDNSYSMDEPVDMIVSNKKRRVSSSPYDI